MRIAVLGSGGMLGKAILNACAIQNVACWPYEHNDFDIADASTYATFDDCDVVINCVGVIPNRFSGAPSGVMVAANALGPHVLAAVCGKPIIHVSTDCVFSGIYDEPYPITFNPDPIDLYGRTKLVGEVKADNVLNVRTSFIGFDHGLLHWLCSFSDYSTLDGWEYAWWSGSTVWAVAAELVKLAGNFPGGGIAHLATAQPVSKLNVLLYLKAVLDLKVQIRPVMRPIIDRSLEPTIILPDLMNEEVRKDLVGRYQRLYTSGAVPR